MAQRHYWTIRSKVGESWLPKIAYLLVERDGSYEARTGRRAESLIV